MSAVQEIAVVPLEQLRELVRETVASTLAQHQPTPTPRLLDRSETAEFLGCSLPTLDRLRSEGMPELRVGDAPRFERDAVIAWLRERRST